MAGNTKLKGFGANGYIQLERWGKKADVQIDPGSLDKIREACHTELPIRAPNNLYKGVYITFNDRRLGIEIMLDGDRAKELKEILQTSSLDTRHQFLDSLELAIEDYDTYFDESDEPGIE